MRNTRTGKIELLDYESWTMTIDCDPTHVQTALFSVIEYAIEGIKINMNDRELTDNDRDIINTLLQKIEPLKQLLTKHDNKVLDEYDIPYLKMLASGVKVYSVI